MVARPLKRPPTESLDAVDPAPVVADVDRREQALDRPVAHRPLRDAEQGGRGRGVDGDRIDIGGAHRSRTHRTHVVRASSLSWPQLQIQPMSRPVQRWIRSPIGPLLDCGHGLAEPMTEERQPDGPIRQHRQLGALAIGPTTGADDDLHGSFVINRSVP